MADTPKPGLLQRALRAATSSALASACDVLILLALLRAAHVAAGTAAALGCLAGGLINFTLTRRWVFRPRRSNSRSTAQQLALYGLLVIAGGALLAGAIVHVATVRFAVPVLSAKALAAVLVFCLWNYPVSSMVVFRRKELS